MAGGEGSRAGGELPKQFQRLLGIPVLWWSVMAFHRENPDTEITIVMHPGFFDEYDIMLSELPADLRDIRVRLVAGGRSRGHSVSNGLMGLPDDKDALVAVHDAARPLVTEPLIREGWNRASESGAAVPVVKVTDSLRELEGEGSRQVDRSRFRAVQTPQIFRCDLLKRAYRLEDRPEFTDDASRVEALGEKITLIEGDYANIKITNPIDFKIAEVLLQKRETS